MELLSSVVDFNHKRIQKAVQTPEGPDSGPPFSRDKCSQVWAWCSSPPKWKLAPNKVQSICTIGYIQSMNQIEESRSLPSFLFQPTIPGHCVVLWYSFELAGLRGWGRFGDGSPHKLQKLSFGGDIGTKPPQAVISYAPLIWKSAQTPEGMWGRSPHSLCASPLICSWHNGATSSSELLIDWLIDWLITLID